MNACIDFVLFTIPCDQTEGKKPEIKNGWRNQDKDSSNICNEINIALPSNIEPLILPTQLPNESEVSNEDMQNEYDEDDMGAAIEAMKNTDS